MSFPGWSSIPFPCPWLFFLDSFLIWVDVFSEMMFFCAGTAEEEPPAEETDAQPVKRAAEEEEVGWHQA